MAYIAGYIVHRISQKVCTSCKDKVVGEVDADNPNHEFLSAKSYGFLKAPSNLLLGIVELLEIRFRKVIKSIVHTYHVKAQLALELEKVAQLKQINCGSCHVQFLVMHIVKNIRLNHSIKEINHNLRDNNDRETRNPSDCLTYNCLLNSLQ